MIHSDSYQNIVYSKVFKFLSPGYKADQCPKKRFRGFDASGIAESKSLQLSEVRQSSSASSCDDEEGREALFRMAFIHFAKKEMVRCHN